MRDADAKSQEPDAEAGIVATTLSAPGRAIVTGDPIRQAVKAKDFDQGCLGNVSGVSGASLQRDGKARMVIQNGQRVTTSLGKLELAFEIHLPKFIRCGSLKTLEGSMLGRLFGVQ